MGRQSPPTSFCLDMKWLGKYWNCFEGQGRVYHHTGPINLIYGLREGLAMMAEEGLEKCWDRHREVAQKLYQGIKTIFHCNSPTTRHKNTIELPLQISFEFQKLDSSLRIRTKMLF